MQKKPTPPQKVTFLPNSVSIEFQCGSTILELAIKNKIEISHACGGMGSCGTCRVIVKQGLESLPERNEIEQTRAEDLSFSKNERLSCQTLAIDGLTVEIPKKTKP